MGDPNHANRMPSTLPWPWTGSYRDGTTSAGGETGNPLAVNEVAKGNSTNPTNWVWRVWTMDPYRTDWAWGTPISATGFSGFGPDADGFLPIK